MAKIYTVADIQELEDGQLVTRFEGTLTDVSPVFKDKRNDPPEWRMQILDLKDEEGEKIKAKVWDREDQIPLKWKGETITIMAQKGTKGWSGVTAKDDKDKKTGKTLRILNVNKSGVVTLAGTGVADNEVEQEQEQEQEQEARPARGKTRQEDTQPEPEQEEAGQASEGEKLFKGRLQQYANTYGLCMDAAETITELFQVRSEERRGKGKGVEVTDDHFQKLTSSLFIAMTKDEMHLEVPKVPIFKIKGESDAD